MSVERIGDDGTLARRAAAHAALGEPARLRIVDALALSDLSPSELGEILDAPSNLLAHHIDVLVRAGLVARHPSHADRRRRYLRLRADAAHLLGDPWPPLVASSVLFVCTANSARSQLAAAMWNDLEAGGGIPATSAGTEPAARIHPGAVRAAARRGLDLTRCRPRHVGEEQFGDDLVVTVCDRAHEHLRRRAPSARRLHWSVADPAERGTAAAFDVAVTDLADRIAGLAPRVVAAPPRVPVGR